MNWIAELRKKYGLSQQFLATYLSVSQTVIALCEQNERELPAKAMLMLAPFLVDNPLQPLTNEIDTQLKSFQTNESNELVQAAASRQVEYQLKLVRLQQNLSTMQQKEQQAMNTIALASRISMDASDMPPDKKLAFVNLLLTSAFVTLKENGAVAQAVVLEKIAMLEAVVKK